MAKVSIHALKLQSAESACLRSKVLVLILKEERWSSSERSEPDRKADARSPGSVGSHSGNGERTHVLVEPGSVRRSVGKEEVEDTSPSNGDGSEDDKDELPTLDGSVVRETLDSRSHQRADHATPTYGRVPDCLSKRSLGTSPPETGL